MDFVPKKLFPEKTIIIAFFAAAAAVATLAMIELCGFSTPLSNTDLIVLFLCPFLPMREELSSGREFASFFLSVPSMYAPFGNFGLKDFAGGFGYFPETNLCGLRKSVQLALCGYNYVVVFGRRIVFRDERLSLVDIILNLFKICKKIKLKLFTTS